ncbi:MAG: putative membrane protein YqjE [Verrucomicrobia bacterium]|nr:MAG: putative membrane protein YqjE [Verrucomicrobiota bacterium]
MNTETTTRDARGPEDSREGVFHPVREMVLSALSYLRARLELAGIEGKEALTRLAGVLLLAAMVATLTLVGYLLLCLALVFGAAQLLHSEHAWIWIAALTGGLHLAAAWGVLRVARSWLEKPMFASTLEEFRKDDAWLKSTAAKPR